MAHFKTFLRGFLLASYFLGVSALTYLTIPWLIPRLFVCFLMGVLGATLYKRVFNGEQGHE